MNIFDSLVVNYSYSYQANQDYSLLQINSSMNLCCYSDFLLQVKWISHQISVMFLRISLEDAS